MAILGSGGSLVYTTRPVGQTTKLFVKLAPGSFGTLAYVSWHIVLCCKDWHTRAVNPGLLEKIDISEAAGALVQVSNTGTDDLEVYTDYINL
jgi:hypothetical protein